MTKSLIAAAIGAAALILSTGAPAAPKPDYELNDSHFHLTN